MMSVNEGAAHDGPLLRVRAVVAYDGTEFHGVAVNRGVATVHGAIIAVVDKVLHHRIDPVCAGRTDAGVHARRQTISFDVPVTTDLAKLQRSLNKLLGPSIVVRSLVPAPGFHARFDAHWRRYRYVVLNSLVDDPALHRTTWHVVAPLNLATMRLACDPLIGEHDFAAFCRAGPNTTVRRVLEAEWFDDGDGLLRFEIQATAFCQQMVRSIVGMMVDIGRGRRSAGEMAGILRARDRRAMGTIAPARGLSLWDVGYPG